MHGPRPEFEEPRAFARDAPARSLLERGLTEQVWANLRQHLPEFIGKHIFEELCSEWVLRQADAGKLPFLPRRVGAYWGRGVPEIDVVAVNEDEHQMLLGDCKWTRQPVDRGTMSQFQVQAAKVQASLAAEQWQTWYVLFSKNSFTDAAKRLLTGTLLVDLPLTDYDLRVE